jgi:hypothetical protein
VETLRPFESVESLMEMLAAGSDRATGCE